MDKDAIKLAIALLQSHLRISPKRVREAPHTLFRWILRKVPNEIKEKCDLITERINIAEAAGEDAEPIFNGTVLTLQSLSNEFVEYIKKASTKLQNEVSAAEREKRKKLQVTEWAKKPPCTMCGASLQRRDRAGLKLDAMRITALVGTALGAASIALGTPAREEAHCRIL